MSEPIKKYKIVGFPKPDWNQNDETAPDYIKNRPFYESNGLDVISECEVSSISSNWYTSGSKLYSGNVDLPSAEYVYGKEYTIEINGETHVMSLTQQFDNQMGGYFVGFNIADGATVVGTPRFNANVLFGAYAYNYLMLSDGDTFTASLWVCLAQTVSLPATIRVGLEAETLVQLDPKYIKDMYYEKRTQEVIIPETTIEASGAPIENPFTIEFIEGQTYLVTWNSVEYECVAYIAEGPNTPSIGNGSIGNAGGGNEEPFFCTVFEGFVLLFAGEDGTHTISITEVKLDLKQIDSKYIKDMYYTEPKIITETRSGVAKSADGWEFVDPEFAALLRENFKTAEYVANDKNVSYKSHTVRDNGVIEISTTNYWYVYIYPDSRICFGDIGQGNFGSGSITITYESEKIHTLDPKYLPILEESAQTVFETVIELNEENSNEVVLEDPTLKKLVGKYVVTVDGVSKTVEFIENIDYSYTSTNDYSIETWDGGIYIGHAVAGTHSVKIDKINDVIKEEHLPDSVAHIETGASVGQIIVVKAVDDNGKPTEWETADLPQGGGGAEWTTIVDFISEEAVSTIDIPFTAEIAEKMDKATMLVLTMRMPKNSAQTARGKLNLGVYLKGTYYKVPFLQNAVNTVPIGSGYDGQVRVLLQIGTSSANFFNGLRSSGDYNTTNFNGWAVDWPDFSAAYSSYSWKADTDTEFASGTTLKVEVR